LRYIHYTKVFSIRSRVESFIPLLDWGHGFIHPIPSKSRTSKIGCYPKSIPASIEAAPYLSMVKAISDSTMQLL